MVVHAGTSAMTVFRQLGPKGPAPILCVGDHASNHVPQDIDLHVAEETLQTHIAVDIGVAGMAEHCAKAHNWPAHLSTVSRLVCDMHREIDDPAIVPKSSDGVEIPGNTQDVLSARIARFHVPYHAALSALIDQVQPRLLVALHSFTPRLADRPEPRPWQIGLLYNQDERAARIAIAALREQGLCVGDNEPYSGKQLNATMDRHGEARGIPYLTVEVRQDLVSGAAGQREWSDRIAQVAQHVLDRLDR